MPQVSPPSLQYSQIKEQVRILLAPKTITKPPILTEIDRIYEHSIRVDLKNW
jgi:hypothetical protein